MKVYVPQEPSRYDHDIGTWVATIDLTPALKFGTEIVTLLPPDANRIHTVPLVQVLKERLREFTENDFICAVGDPSLIAAAAAIAARQTGGKLKLLKWDRRLKQYLLVELENL